MGGGHASISPALPFDSVSSVSSGDGRGRRFKKAKNGFRSEVRAIAETRGQSKRRSATPWNDGGIQLPAGDSTPVRPPKHEIWEECHGDAHSLASCDTASSTPPEVSPRRRDSRDTISSQESVALRTQLRSSWR